MTTATAPSATAFSSNLGEVMAEPRPVEEQVLLLCARVPLTEAAHERLRSLVRRPIDWAMLVDLADRHAMLPLLGHHIEGLTGHDGVPDGIRSVLRARFVRNAAQSLVLAAELPRLLDELRQADIPAIAYKGPLLAVAAYGSIVLRRMRDLDILIGGEKLDAAREILAKRGYRQYTPLLQGPLRLRLDYQCGMIRQSDGAIVELHWGLAPPNMLRGPSFEDLWSRHARRSFHGLSLPGLSNEDRLIALCVHGSKHGWRRLEWVAAVAGVLDSADACDWDTVRQRAEELDARRMVRLGLVLARDLIGASAMPLGDWIDADPVVADLSEQVSRSLFRAQGASDADALVAFQWRVQDTTRSRLRFALFWPTIRVGRRIAAARRPQQRGD